MKPIEWDKLTVICDCPYRFKGKWDFGNGIIMDIDGTKVPNCHCNLMLQDNKIPVATCEEQDYLECSKLSTEKEKKVFAHRKMQSTAAMFMSIWARTGQPSKDMFRILARYKSPLEAAKCLDKMELSGEQKQELMKSEEVELSLLQKVQATASKARNLGRSIVRAVKERASIISKDAQQQRLEICKQCPLYDNGNCSFNRGGCGCKMSIKVKLSTDHCPQGKW